MAPMTRGQAIGITAVVIGVLGITAAQLTGLPGHGPGITLREAPAGRATVPSTVVTSPTPAGSTAASTNAGSARIYVHVAGAVNAPGVYPMEPGQRNVDAVRAAGGAARGADLDAVNLAAPVNDGSRLFIPMAPDSPAPAETLTHGATNASGESAERAPETARLGKLRDPAAGQIDINAAGPDELMRVPGVGATMAARIVEYRSVNGPFSRAEDLARVSGIGARKLAKMLPFVSVR